MKINRVELFSVKIPLAKNKPGFFAEHPYFEPSWIPGFRQSEMRFYLLKLSTDAGHTGFSAMPSMGTERHGLGTIMGNYLLGINPMDIDLANQRIQEFAYLGLRNGWVDSAIYDIIGKELKQPLHKLLGGEGGFVYPYASTGSNHGHSTEKVSTIIKKFIDEGYRGVKLRVKSDELQPMVDYMGAARKAAGADLHLMVDCNQGWPVSILDETPKWDLDFATAFGKGIEEFDIKWIEEPLNKGNFGDLAKLRKAINVPIAGGEMNSSWSEFKALLDAGSLDIYQPDAMLVGGTYVGGITLITWVINEIKKRNAQGEKLKFSPHTWTTGLGFAVGLQLVGLIDKDKRSLLEYPNEGNWRYEFWNRFIKTDLSPDKDGRIKIPEEPGLGIEIDMSIIRRFGKRVYDGTPSKVARYTIFDRGLKGALYLKGKKAEQEARAKPVEFKVPEAPF